MKLKRRSNWNHRPVYTDLLEVDRTANTRKQLTFDVIEVLFALPAAFQTQTVFPVYRRKDERDESKSVTDDNQTLNLAVPKPWYGENNTKADAIERAYFGNVRSWSRYQTTTDDATADWDDLSMCSNES